MYTIINIEQISNLRDYNTRICTLVIFVLSFIQGFHSFKNRFDEYETTMCMVVRL